MIAIIGLGNPGREYNWTRHNIGFEVVGKLAYDNDINMNKEKYKAIVGEGRIGNEKVLLIQPLTYMNLSGDSVREFVNFYKLSPEEIIVVCDDINLPVGGIRIRKKGSDGGQKGLRSITDDEKDDIISGITDAAEAVSIIVKTGDVDKAMNKFNKKGQGKQ